jgi:hypothetical protein
MTVGENDAHPSVLFRCFRERAHAEEFLSGRIRFGYLQHYRANYEGGRRDIAEGIGRVREWRPDRKAVVLTGSDATMVDSPGEVPVHSEFGSAVFICCLTAPPDDRWGAIKKDFGDVVVRIADPQRFLCDIRLALSREGRWQRNAEIALFQVEYSKDELVPTRDTTQRAHDLMQLAIAQKIRAYDYQFEHRIALISFVLPILEESEPARFPPDHIYVNIGQPLEYARVVRRPRCAIHRWLAAVLGHVPKMKGS